MLGKFSWQKEANSCLDLTRSDGGPRTKQSAPCEAKALIVPLVVMGQLAGFSSDPLEEIIDKGVHDGHGLGGDTGVGVHLLEDLVDVDGVRLLPPLVLLLLVSLGDGLLGLARLLGGLSGGFGRHVVGWGFRN